MKAQGKQSNIQRSKALRLAALWFVAYALILFWWWPGYYQLWSVPLIAFVILFATYLHQRLGRPLVNSLSVQSGLVVLIFSICVANSLAAYLPMHDIKNNDYYTTTMAIGRNTSPGDLIIVPGNDEYETYIPYFVKRQVVSLHAILVDHQNNIHESLDDIETKMKEAKSTGHGVFIFSELHDSVKTYADVYELHHLENQVVAGFFQRFTIVDTLETGSLVIYELDNIL